MKVFISFLAFLNGGFMLADGVFVMVTGKYIGPEKPGPWSHLFEECNVNVFSLGPVFVIYGIAWLFFLYSIWKPVRRFRSYGIFLCVLTLWYLLAGTLFSLIILAWLWPRPGKIT